MGVCGIGKVRRVSAKRFFLRVASVSILLNRHTVFVPTNRPFHYQEPQKLSIDEFV